MQANTMQLSTFTSEKHKLHSWIIKNLPIQGWNMVELNQLVEVLLQVEVSED